MRTLNAKLGLLATTGQSDIEPIFMFCVSFSISSFFDTNVSVHFFSCNISFHSRDVTFFMSGTFLSMRIIRYVGFCYGTTYSNS